MTSHLPTSQGLQQQKPVGHTASVRRMLHSLVGGMDIAPARARVPGVRPGSMMMFLGLQEAVEVLVSSCSIAFE